ncbi:MAG: glycerate kinase [Candidatus Hodarchaeaceae archaeon]|nr:glycerate kinase [Candidatus Hodarchaeaceae archaeon]
MLVKNERQLLERAKTPELRKARGILIEIVNRAISSADPSSAMRRRLRLVEGRLRVGAHEFDLSEVGKIIVVGGGKASGNMAEVLEEILGDRITGGVVNVPEGAASRCETRKIKLVEAGHPLPTEAGVGGAEEMIDLVSDLEPQDLVICLLSGGGSALVTLPAEGISLDELRETTQLLLKSGATIQEVNAVRKHLSRIKGGQLAKAAYPAKVITLLISDVVGDRLDTIASGPTYPDSTTYSDALAVIERYEILKKVPVSILRHLRLGAEGKVPETPKPGEKYFLNTLHEVIASNADAVGAAAEVGRSHGFNVSVLTATMHGEAREVGAHLAAVAKDVMETGKPVSRPALLISGGETTVTVKGEGTGGRNQELALSAAIGISGLRNVAVASFSTDGIDGPTDAAGAVVDGFTIERARHLMLDPVAYLERNDSYSFFKGLEDLLVTGPTGTNVMDVTCLILI